MDKHDPRLTAYVLGELEGEELVAVETALEQVPGLAQVVDEIRETTLAIVEEFDIDSIGLGDDTTLGLSGEQKRSIMTAASRQPPHARSTSFLGFVLKNWAWAAVAATVLVMATPWLVNHFGNTQLSLLPSERTLDRGPSKVDDETNFGPRFNEDVIRYQCIRKD